MSEKLPLYVDETCQSLFAARIRALNPIVIEPQRVPSVLHRQSAVLFLRIGPRFDATALGAVREIRRDNPLAVILLCLPWDELRETSLHKYVRAGADEILPFGSDDELRGCCERVLARITMPPPKVELEKLQQRYERSLSLAAVSHGIRNGSIHLKASQLSQRFGYADRTLREQLAAAGFPCPRDVCRCGWFLNLAELRSGKAQSAETIARRLGFADATDLRKKRAALRVAIQTETRLASFAATFPRLLNELHLYP